MFYSISNFYFYRVILNHFGRKAIYISALKRKLSLKVIGSIDILLVINLIDLMVANKDVD